MGPAAPVRSASAGQKKERSTDHRPTNQTPQAPGAPGTLLHAASVSCRGHFSDSCWANVAGGYLRGSEPCLTH